jgi:sRNA-binding regulator protein Hfq
VSVYSPEELERYYKMRKKPQAEASKGTGGSEAKAPQKHGGSEQGDLVREYVGKQVKLRLMDGDVFEGKLEKASRFELVLATESGERVLLYKHAVAYVHPSKET